MLWHYLTTTLHNLRRHRLATLTHVLGLALGLACFVVSFAFVDGLRHGEPNLSTADRTYVLTQDLLIHNAGKLIPASPYATLAAYEYLKSDFPQLEAVARAAAPGLIGGGGRLAFTSGEHGGFVYHLYVDRDFMKIFQMRVLAGDPNDPFKGGTGSVITASAAQRIFGSHEVIGRRFLFASKSPGVITAVIADVPQPSHLGDSRGATVRFDMLSSMNVGLFGPTATDWTSPTAFTYLVLPANGSISVAALRASLKGFGERHMPASTGHSNFDIVPVARVRQLMIDRSITDTGFSIISGLYILDALVLIVACFNYANLATALALRRTREIALRKIVGAKRRQLVAQCMFEAAVVGVLALMVAVMLTLLLIPVVNSLLTQALQPRAFMQPRMWLFLVGLVFAVVALAGAYPAFALSRLRPVQALRATSGRGGAGHYVPRALIGLQFMAAGFLIVMVLVVQAQNHTMRAALVGISRNPAIVVTTSLSDTAVDLQTLRSRLLESPAVESVSSTDSIPWVNFCCWVFIVSHSTDPAVKAVQAAGNRIGPDYFRTVGLKLLAGRTFREASEDELSFTDGDGKRTLNVVIDRTLTEQLGYRTPAAALGAIIYRQPYLPRLTLRVVGVVEDAADHLTDAVGSRSDLYLFAPKMTSYAVVRFHPENVSAAVAQLEKTWKTLAPGVPLERRFTDQLFEDSYETFGAISSVATGLTVCAVLIALMGLSGMAVQVTNGRLREIGVRKTLGAKSHRILALLLVDFAKPVVIANLIAWPFAYLAARAYLSLFFTPMRLSPVVFLASLVASVGIACLVVCGQSLRASRAQPAEVLRYE